MTEPPPPPETRARPRLRRVHAAYAALALCLVAIVGVVWTATAGNRPSRALWHQSLTSPVATASPTPSPSPSPSVQTANTITLGAVGDIIMGKAPGSLPADGGRTFFDKVKDLFAVDFMMGNMEQPITEDTGHVKCRPDQTSCHQFRVPPTYAAHLKAAGFHLLNQANNHGNDYGPTGYTNTQKALTDAGLLHTGSRNYVAVAEVKGVKVGVVGFSSYPRDNSLIDLAQARTVIERAAAKADIVVVQVHMGAEGSDKGHVKPGTEMFLGENRGDPIAFSHAVIDAGADLVIGHGPHTLRGMELYKGRLIAYSLGNFAGGTGLKGGEILGWGGVLQTTLSADGALVSGRFHSTIFQTRPGIPEKDSQKRGLDLIRKLTKDDFPDTGPTISADGLIGLH
ncbi:CapA family protein [Allorhizocola rhizosphaerae]|uniref:CapA family protein n=1 Tax=Allorhizocola rhizosphaerae TaxID=1872709 RepID=UPI000E3DB51B|nr:CapA family protein [Allorhizocola rhizosphaerae]